MFFVCLPEDIHNISTYVGTVDAIDRIVPCISKVKALCPKPAYVLSSRPISSPAFRWKPFGIPQVSSENDLNDWG